jgi:hypothetical protein
MSVCLWAKENAWQRNLLHDIWEVELNLPTQLFYSTDNKDFSIRKTADSYTLVVGEDNQAAINMSKGTQSAKTKHFSRDWYLAVDRMQHGEFEMIKVDTKVNRADAFTKPLHTPRFDMLKTSLVGDEKLQRHFDAVPLKTVVPLKGEVSMIQANFGLNPNTKLGGWAHSLDAVSVVVEGTSAPVTVSLMQEMAAPDPVILLKFAEQLNLAQKNCRSMEEKVMYVRTSLVSTSKAMADEAYAKDQWFVANNTDQQWLATRKDIGEAESLAKAVELFHADLTASEAAHQVLLKKHLANNEAGLARVDDLQEILAKLPEFVRLAAELAAYARSLLDEVISLRTLEQTPRHAELVLQA